MRQSQTVVVFVGLWAGLAAAADPAVEPGPGRGPPPEALQACAGLASGAACSVVLGGQALAGTCDTPPDGSALACRPASMPPPPQGRGPHRAPPREALAACASLTADAACSFTLGSHSVSGTCATPPDGSALACRPSGPPPGHHGPPPEAVAACASLSANASCSFAHGSSTVTGTCVAPPDASSGALACRPDRPPPPGASDGPAARWTPGSIEVSERAVTLTAPEARQGAAAG
jgi:hypothetical protein